LHGLAVAYLGVAALMAAMFVAAFGLGAKPR
jgi:hypothetical protein